MPKLTKEEKIAGRVFRDDVQGKLLASFDTDPPTYQVPNFLAIYRHLCPKRQNRSTALELKENYAFSPEYLVYVDTSEVIDLSNPEAVAGGVSSIEEPEKIPAGRFGFIYKEGKCKGCKQTARSRAGQLVDAWDRPPVQGRVAR